MSFSPVLSMVHSGAAILLSSLAIISVWIAVLIAVKPDFDRASGKLVKRANVVGLIEQIAVVTVTLTGVIAVFMGPWSLSERWVWLSLISMVFYSMARIFVTKPARLVVMQGGSAIKVGMQVILQIGHVLLILVVFSLMLLKPF